jgi:Protein of unknown function (DUF2934)
MNRNTSDVIKAAITGDGWMGKDSAGRQRPTLDEIARLAYSRYEVNGRRTGYDIDDWLIAERQLAHDCA